MQLRPYQEHAVRSIWHYFMSGQTGNPIVAMPTGTGKSVVIARFIQSVLQAYPSQRILSLTHVKELIEQNHAKLGQLAPEIPAGIFSAGLKRRDHSLPVTFAGIASVAKRARLFQNTSLVLIDECHLVSPKGGTMYQQLLTDLRGYNPHVKVIGFSATPFRLKVGALTDGGLFTDVCYDNTGPESFRDLIYNGWLAPLVPKKPQTELDTDDIGIRGGEYIASDVGAALDAQDITRKALAESCELARDRRKWLVFAASIEHAVECAEVLRAMGVPARCVHSKMSSEERAANLEAFKQGHIRAIVNRDILTTGFDQPDVDAIIMLRPTRSPGLWVQMLGRGTRPAPGKKDCLVLDFAGNTRKLGPIDDPVIPTPRRKKGGGGSSPVKLCPECDTWLPAAATSCAECGYEFPRRLKLDDEASTGALMSSITDDKPEIVTLSVQRMVATRHQKAGKPDAMRVMYYCGRQGLHLLNVFVCLDHGGYATKRAQEWWYQHYGTVPDDVEHGLALAAQARCPTHVRVWINKKYPEVLAYDFTGTAFGEAEPKAVSAAGEPASSGYSAARLS